MTRTRPNLFRDLLLATSALVASSALAVSVAHADGSVSGGKVIVGKAVITTSGGLTTIDQASKKALINWSSFSIPSGSTVDFEQPGSQAITVNRVTGSDPSNIFGNLLANGRIWLINSNGILFGHGSQINVGSLIATTSDISDSDFQNGHNRFGTSKNPNASVVNQGTIHAADHGSVVLSAPHVSNSGVIQANLGTVVLGGASAFTVDLTGDNLIRYQVTEGVTQTQKNADGTAAALVANSGTIKANGGKVLMTERAAQQVEDSVINNTGIVEATSVASHNGEIVLDAGDGGTVNAGGTLDASGKATGQTGGSVTLTGSTVNVTDGAKIDASGDRGGGTVLIGGGVHGGGALQHATTTNIGNATITADAITKGNGGTVAVWSDGNTKFAGHVSARGGAQGGNGGLVETSGKNLSVDPAASVDTMAAGGGKTGLWLLDPQNIDIVNGGTGGLNGSSIDPQTIINALGTTDVELEATNNITIDSDVIYSSGNAFTLLAGNDIYAYASVQNGGSGNINLIAGWDGTTTALGSLTNPGVYGNNGGSVFIGTSSAHGNAAIGSFGGTTTVAGANIDVDAEEGYAQIGYHSAGSGDIDVLATGNISVLSGIENSAQIGNGGTDVTGTVGGDISLTTTGGEVVVSAAETEDDFANRSFATIGQLARNNSSESGDITIDTNGGALELTATGEYSYAHIGNILDGQSSGDISGDINIDAGAMQLVAGSSNAGAIDFADIGTGDFHVGSTTGAITGDITVDAQSLTMDALTSGSTAQARIGDLGEGGAVTGDISVNTTGDVDLSASAGGLSTIGGTSLFSDANGLPLPGEGSGDVTINSGGNITLASQDTGTARISTGGWNSGTMSVTAKKNIVMETEGNGSSDGSGLSYIGTLTGSMDIDVTATTGSIQLNADSDYGEVGIGNSDNGAFNPTSGNITISAKNSNGGGVGLSADGTNASVWIGNQSDTNSAVSGNIGIFTNILELSANGGSSSAQIGNGGNFASGNVTGDISIAVAGQTSAESDGGTSWIGNLTGAGGTESGNLTLATGEFDDDNAGQNFAADLGTTEDTGGDVLLGVTGTNPIRIENGTEYSSPHTLSILAAGDIDLGSTIENDGSGAINMIAGWDGRTLDSSQFTTSGVYGNNGGTVSIGTDFANGDAGIGSAGGLTTVAGANIDVGSENGYAQIGYHGAGSGDIDVLATQSVDVHSDGTDVAQIGNGGNDVTGNIGGDISVKLTDAGGEILVAYDGSDAGDNPAAAIIGNTGTRNSSESGDILVDADGGTLTLGAVGVFGIAQIGNRNWGTSTGSASGDITVNAGALELVGGGGDFDQSENLVQIGNGAKLFGTSLGGVSGDIAVNAGTLVMESIGDSTGDNYAEARIGNLDSAPVSGDVDITTTGDVDLISSGFALTNIGSLSDPVDANGNPVQSSNTGDLTVTSGGAISMLAENGGETRMESGGLTDGNVSVTANGDITLEATGTSTLTFTTAEIGSLSNGQVNGTISVTSNTGNIELDAGDTDTAQIGVLNGLPADTLLDADINVSAGGDLSLMSSGTGSAIIGNGNTFGQNDTSGNIAITVAGTTTVGGSQGGLAWIGNLADDGFTETGNLTIVTGSFGGDDVGQMFAADLGSSSDTGGDVTIGITKTGASVIGGDVEYSSPHTLSILTAGDLDLRSTIENSGSGDINVVAGWDGHTLDSSQFTTAGVYGNNGGNLNIGGSEGASIGTAGGMLTVAADNINLDATNGFAQLGYAGAGGGDINVQAAGKITLTGGTSEGDYAQIGNGAYALDGNTSGNITVNAGGDVSLQSGNESFGTYAQIGDGGDESEGNATGDISVTAASLALTADEGRAQVGNGGASASGNFTGDVTVSTTGAVRVAAGGVDTWGFAMIGNGGDSTSGNDTGDISVTAGGNVSLSGSGDFAQIGNGGWGSSGAHQGDITINAADVTVDGGEVNEFSYAQIGNGGEASEGDNSGDIKVTASGDVTLTGSGRYAQIGHGGGFSDGNNSGDITVSAGGSVTLTGGDTQEAYAQIGLGGAETNSNGSGGYSNTGLITVSGEAVTLQAGTGEEAYSQIGQGGFLSGEGLTGAGVDSGDITVNSQTTVSLLGGDGNDAYSQIGNGGDQVNAEAGPTATADIEGNIMITALNGVSLQGGAGNSAYTQIGNGGLGIELQTTAPSSNFTIGGDIVVVSSLTLTGGGTGTNAYAQVGDGDASLNSVGNITGDITVGSVTQTNGTPGGSVALLGNATGNGTVSGSINGGGGASQIGDQVGTIASLVQTVDTVNFENIAPPTTVPVADEFTTEGVELNTQPAGPLQQLASSDESGEGKQPSDAVANSVGQSLNGKSHKQARVAQVIIPGVLKQIVFVNAKQPKGIPPADEDYSSWGNEAFWQW